METKKPSKVDLLDVLLEIEDDYEKEFRDFIKEKVTNKMSVLYGLEGTRLCDIYYSDQDNEPKYELCDDCAAKAETMVELLKESTSLIDAVSDESTQTAISMIGNKFTNDVDDFINKITSKLKDIKFSTNQELTKNIILGLILKHFKNKNQNE